MMEWSLVYTLISHPDIYETLLATGQWEFHVHAHEFNKITFRKPRFGRSSPTQLVES